MSDEEIVKNFCRGFLSQMILDYKHYNINSIQLSLDSKPSILRFIVDIFGIKYSDFSQRVIKLLENERNNRI